MEQFYKRIGYQGNLSEISKIICKDFNLGEFKSDKLIKVGYEDFNFRIETTKGRYFVKIFSNSRTDEGCSRYLDIMLKAIEKGVSFPKLYKSEQGYLHTIKMGKINLRLVVMQFIDGESYFDLRIKPNSDEIKELARQTALINSISIWPSFTYDSWAIVNFLKEYEEKSKYLSLRDSNKINPLIQSFKNAELDKLPHCFVHGDIIVTNVIRDRKGKIWIIDFSVSYRYPRIQEIAIIACNLLFDEDSKKNSENNLKIFLNEYQKHIRLTPRELEILPSYIKFAHAMHILEANYAKVVNKNNTKENEYWLNQGRAGLY